MSAFRKVIYFGTCLCGHSYEDHHLGMVLNPEALAIMGPYLQGECEFFGWNESGGFDENGNPHCMRYVDADDPEESFRVEGQGTRR